MKRATARMAAGLLVAAALTESVDPQKKTLQEWFRERQQAAAKRFGGRRVIGRFVPWAPAKISKRMRKVAGITGSRQSKRWHQAHRHDFENAQ